ncbi:MAG: 3-hydroxyacyl-CoA dehydrogenase, partial [Ardenticatenales bacterium]|nr:3-hydroxyacyl-CoA dehydrogenase [Ardenticatenales bacterium]
LDPMSEAQVVIEAAPERLELKKHLFTELERLTPPEAILATNTSTLSVTQIAASTQTPARVAGMHFFNPAALMPLVEVIAGAATEPSVVDTLMALAQALGKTPVRVKDVPGFIVNRVARPFHLEGLRLLEHGVADPATIDRLMREGGGFKMGPFELQDLIGIDINFAASQSVYDSYDQVPRFRPSSLQRQQVESGRLGRKSGRGWYDYEEKDKAT